MQGKSETAKETKKEPGDKYILNIKLHLSFLPALEKESNTQMFVNFNQRPDELISHVFVYMVSFNLRLVEIC